MHCAEARELIAAGHMPLLYTSGQQNEPYDEIVDRHVYGCYPCKEVVRAELWKRFRRRPTPWQLFHTFWCQRQLVKPLYPEIYIDRAPLQRVIYTLLAKSLEIGADAMKLQSGPAEPGTPWIDRESELDGRYDGPRYGGQVDNLRLSAPATKREDAEAFTPPQLTVYHQLSGGWRQQMTLPGYLNGPLRAWARDLAGLPAHRPASSGAGRIDVISGDEQYRFEVIERTDQYGEPLIFTRA